MNQIKAQTEILKAMMDPKERVCYWQDDDKDVTCVAMCDRAYCIPDDMLHLSMNTCQVLSPLPGMLPDVHTAKELEATDVYRNGGKARQYLFDHDPCKPVYINTKLLSAFDEPNLYQAVYNQLGLVTVGEFNFDTNRVEVVGYAMPMRLTTENNND